MSTGFVAARGLGNAHVQTIGTALPLWTAPLEGTEALRIPLPEGGALHAEASWQTGHEGDARTAVVILHGVGGSAESSYARRAARALYRAGFHVVRVNMRGAGTSVVDAPDLYHAGLVQDPRVVIDAVARREGVRDVALLGFSLGGNVSLNLAASWKGAPPAHVRAVATISAPLDLVKTSRELERLRTLPYRFWVVRGLVSQGRAFADMHPGRAQYDVAKLGSIRTIRAYDELVIAPMHGFASADEYYRRTSSGRGLADIEVPTLLVHAADDPMVPEATVRPSLRIASRAVRVAWSERGGHVGWLGAVTEEAWLDTWAVQQVIAFFREPRRS